MIKTPLTFEAEVQHVLNGLWGERLIPFALSVGKITTDNGEYTIHFHDSRIYAVNLAWTIGDALMDLVLSAILARMNVMSAH